MRPQLPRQMRSQYCALRERVRRWASDPRFSPTRVMRALGQKDADAFRLPVDIYITETALVLLASTPGMNAEDLRITLEGDTLILEGAFTGPIEHGGFVFQERPQGPFRRAFQLHTPVEAESVVATLRQGVLTVTLPKGARQPRKVIPIRELTAK